MTCFMLSFIIHHSMYCAGNDQNDDDIIEITRITSDDESSESSIGSPINSAVLGLDIDMPV